MESTLIHTLQPVELQALIKTAVQEALSKPQKSPEVDDKLITYGQIAEMFSVDISSVHNWRKKGLLKPHGIGGRVFFKLSEVMAALVPLHPHANQKS